MRARLEDARRFADSFSFRKAGGALEGRADVFNDSIAVRNRNATDGMSHGGGQLLQFDFRLLLTSPSGAAGSPVARRSEAANAIPFATALRRPERTQPVVPQASVLVPSP